MFLETYGEIVNEMYSNVISCYRMNYWQQGRRMINFLLDIRIAMATGKSMLTWRSEKVLRRIA